MESMINNGKINSNGIDILRPRKFKYYLSNSLRLAWLYFLSFFLFFFFKKLSFSLLCESVILVSWADVNLQALSGDVIYFPLPLYLPSSGLFLSSSSSTFSCWSLATVYPVCLRFCKLELILPLLPSIMKIQCNYIITKHTTYIEGPW